MSFDPDAYLSEKTGKPASSFDPDKYLTDKQQVRAVAIDGPATGKDQGPSSEGIPARDLNPRHAGVVESFVGHAADRVPLVSMASNALGAIEDMHDERDSWSQKYQERRKRLDEALHDSEADHPIASTLGNLAGDVGTYAAATAALPVTASAKIADLIARSRIGRGLADKAIEVGGKAGANLLATLGAVGVQDASHGEASKAPEHVAYGAAAGGLLGLAGKGIAKVAAVPLQGARNALETVAEKIGSTRIGKAIGGKGNEVSEWLKSPRQAQLELDIKRPGKAPVVEAKDIPLTKSEEADPLERFAAKLARSDVAGKSKIGEGRNYSIDVRDPELGDGLNAMGNDVVKRKLLEHYPEHAQSGMSLEDLIDTVHPGTGGASETVEEVAKPITKKFVNKQPAGPSALDSLLSDIVEAKANAQPTSPSMRAKRLAAGRYLPEGPPESGPLIRNHAKASTSDADKPFWWGVRYGAEQKPFELGDKAIGMERAQARQDWSGDSRASRLNAKNVAQRAADIVEQAHQRAEAEAAHQRAEAVTRPFFPKEQLDREALQFDAASDAAKAARIQSEIDTMASARAKRIPIADEVNTSKSANLYAKQRAEAAAKSLAAIRSGRGAIENSLAASAAAHGGLGGLTGLLIGAAAGKPVAHGAIKAIDLAGKAGDRLANVKSLAEKAASGKGATARAAQWALSVEGPQQAARLFALSKSDLFGD